MASQWFHAGSKGFELIQGEYLRKKPPQKSKLRKFTARIRDIAAGTSNLFSSSKPRRLSRVMFVTMLLFPTISILTLGGYGIYDEWSEFQSQTHAIHSESIKNQKQIIRAEVNRTIDEISFWRAAILSCQPDASEEAIREAVFSRITQLTFGNDDKYFIFVGSFDGIEVVGHKGSNLTGKNLFQMQDIHGTRVFQEQLKIARTSPSGAFMTYNCSETNDIADAKSKLSFIRGIDNLQMFVAAGADLSAIEKMLAERKTKALDHLKQSAFEMIITLGISLFVVILVSCWMTRKIRKSFDAFARFFRKSAFEYAHVNESQISYREFAELASSANHMIVDRMMAETALKESERQMREMLANLQMATVMLERDGTITYVNDYLLKVTGYSREEIIKENWFDIFIPPNNREEMRKVHADVLAGKLEVVAHYENDILTKSGQRRTLSWSNSLFNYSNDGGICGVTSFGQDVTEHRQAEEKVRQNQKKYQSLVSNIPGIIYRCKLDRDWTVLYISDEVSQLTGYPASDFVDNSVRTFESILHRDDTDYVAESVHHAIQTNKPWEIEYRIHHNDGSVRWFYEKGCGIIAENGELEFLDGVILDITDRRRAEQEVQSLAKFPSENPYPIIRVSGDGTVLYANEAASVVLRAWGAEESGKLPDLHQRIIGEVLLSFESSTIESYCPSGEIFSMTFAPVPDADYINIYGHDITERKAAENELKNNEERFRVMHQKSPLSYQSLDPNGYYLDVNPAWLNLMGMSYDEVIGRQFDDFMTDSSRESFRNIFFPELKKTGSLRNVNYELIHKDGHHISVELNGNAAYDEKGNFRQSYCLLQDITEVTKARERQEQHQDKLAHTSRLSVMGQMASELAHELNQPLCAIMGNAESTLRAVNSKKTTFEKVADKIETIVKQTDRMGKIISRIRGFAAKKTGDRSLVHLNNVISEAMGIIDYQAKKSGVKIDLDLDEDINPVIADQILLEQVTLNLIQNSIDALQTIPKPRRKLIISTAQFNGTVEVAVRDTGIGISDINENNVLEPFFTTKSKGLGVGLSISRSIIESHGGKLGFRDNSSEGVTFYFVLPVCSKSKAVNTCTNQG